MINFKSIKNARSKLAEFHWLRYGVIALFATAVITAVLYPAIIITTILSCFAALIVTYVACRYMRGSYKSRQQTPKTPPAHSPRVQKVVKLGSNEKLIWESRQHIIAVLPWCFLIAVPTSLALTMAIGFDWVVAALIVWVAGSGFCAYKIAWWYQYRFCITNQRIIVIEGVEGITSVDYNQMRLDAITDSKITESVPSKLLAWLRFIETEYGYGRLESPGQDQDITHVGPLPFINRIGELIDTHRTPPSQQREDIELLREISNQLSHLGQKEAPEIVPPSQKPAETEEPQQNTEDPS